MPDPHGDASAQPARAAGTVTCPSEPVTDWRARLESLRTYASAPYPPPARGDPLGRFFYGVAQPLFGARMMLRDPGLRGAALAPVLAVALVCLLVALRRAEQGAFATILTFFVTFAALVPVPPVLFARYYARIAARARNELGLGPCSPYLKPISQSFGESISQMIIIAIGVAPLTLAISWAPLWGTILAFGLNAVWTLHWVVVEGLDSARTLEPGQTVASVSEEERSARFTPWFMRAHDTPMPGWARALLLPVRMVGEVVMGLSREWSPEMKIIERNPYLTSGFGIGTVLLLSIPGLNLFFRPALAISGAHLRTRLDREPS
jgi:hypothetical protein